MISIALSDVASAIDAQLPAELDPSTLVRGEVRHDSREVQPGDLFFAIVGETHDGHSFVSSALAAGALLAIVSQPMPGRTMVVADTGAALGRLANAVVRQSSARVFGITGSSGKTSTKDLLGQVLSKFGTTVYPPGSFNNEIGLPMTALSIAESTENLVLEYGARGAGHIAQLCSIAPPEIAIVTNVGSAHVGEFGSPEAIAAAKTELVAALPAHGIAVLNRDDPRVSAMAGACAGAVRWFGMAADSDVQIVRVELDELARARAQLRCDGEIFELSLPLSGAHHVHNAAAVLAAATAVGLPADSVVEALSQVRQQSRWRMEVTQTTSGVTVVNDAYNANPESMAAALRALVQMKPSGGRAWAVVGEMRELGESSLVAHDAVGRQSVRLGVDRLVGIGPASRPIVLGAASEGFYGGEAYYSPDKSDARSYLRDHVAPGDVVLFKASRAIGLEELAEAVIADQGGAVDSAEATT